MRPNKPINPGAHNSGAAGRASAGSKPGGKGRHYVTPVPDEASPEPEASGAAGPETPELYIPGRAAPISQGKLERVDKYVGRASVGPFETPDDDAPDRGEDAAAAEWVDPLDATEIDLSTITIDLRPGLRADPPDTYFQRYGSKVPGHNRGDPAGS